MEREKIVIIWEMRKEGFVVWFSIRRQDEWSSLIGIHLNEMKMSFLFVFVIYSLYYCMYLLLNISNALDNQEIYLLKSQSVYGTVIRHQCGSIHEENATIVARIISLSMMGSHLWVRVISAVSFYEDDCYCPRIAFSICLILCQQWIVLPLDEAYICGE